MSDRIYHRLTIGIALGLALGLGAALMRNLPSQKDNRENRERGQLVLVPKAHLPSEDACRTFAPDIRVPIGRREQRRAVVH